MIEPKNTLDVPPSPQDVAAVTLEFARDLSKEGGVAMIQPSLDDDMLKRIQMHNRFI